MQCMNEQRHFVEKHYNGNSRWCRWTKNKLEFEKRVETHSAREKEKKKYRENKTKKNTFYWICSASMSVVFICMCVYLLCIHHNLNIIAINFGLLTLEFMFFPFPPFSHLFCHRFLFFLFFSLSISFHLSLNLVVESFFLHIYFGMFISIYIAKVGTEDS